MEAKITKKVDIHPRYSHLHPDIEVAVEANPVDTWAKCSVLLSFLQSHIAGNTTVHERGFFSCRLSLFL